MSNSFLNFDSDFDRMRAEALEAILTFFARHP